MYSLHFQRVQVEHNSFSLCFHCTDYPSLDPWKVHFDNKFIDCLVCRYAKLVSHCLHKDYLYCGVIFPFVFFSDRYLYFCVRLRNLAFEILGLVLFLFDLLFLQSFSCLRLRNLACEMDLDLVMFLFDLLCAISLCGLPLWKLACEIDLFVMLFLFDLLFCVVFGCGTLRVGWIFNFFY